ncbi:DUF4382 domain-containing protein, partial [Chloroflexota bacterium]
MNMDREFNEILDECIDRINRGEGIDDCLASYPEYAQELEPLLKAMLLTTDACSLVPRASAKQEARRKFADALEESAQRREKARTPLSWGPGRAKAWAMAAAVMVIALAGYFSVTQLMSPQAIIAQPDPTGNLAFLISDEANAIGDFESLDLTISKIGLNQQDGKWVEFVPEMDQIDLTLLQGDLAQQVWRGDVPEGQYSSAVLYVDSTDGVLKDRSETENIKLPGDKLHLNIAFEVSDDTVTEFVYDVSVIPTGTGRYNLRPVVEESGTDRKIQKVNSQAQGNGQDTGQGAEQSQGDGQDT